MPAFSHVREPEWEGKPLQNVNPFLMVLNAAMKFSHYASLPPPEVRLPQESHDLMKSTMHLVDLLYWVPRVTAGSRGEQIMQDKERRRLEGGEEVSPSSVILANDIILMRYSESPWPPGMNTAEERRDWTFWLMGPSVSHLGAF